MNIHRTAPWSWVNFSAVLSSRAGRPASLYELSTSHSSEMCPTGRIIYQKWLSQIILIKQGRHSRGRELIPAERMNVQRLADAEALSLCT